MAVFKFTKCVICGNNKGSLFLLDCCNDCYTKNMKALDFIKYATPVVWYISLTDFTVMECSPMDYTTMVLRGVVQIELPKHLPDCFKGSTTPFEL